MDIEMISKGAGALAALSVKHVDCATERLAGLTQLQLTHLAADADALAQLAAELAREPVQLPLLAELPDHSIIAAPAPYVLDVDLDLL